MSKWLHVKYHKFIKYMESIRLKKENPLGKPAERNYKLKNSFRMQVCILRKMGLMNKGMEEEN